MRELVLPVQHIENRPPGGQEAVGSALAQGLAHRGVSGDGQQGGGQVGRLLLQDRVQFVGNMGYIDGDLPGHLLPVLAP